ncbi:MAG TPA: EamA family transporter [Jiangellales bacterium]|nr:EamA family transporter [Jiangellales bacterium]
MTPQGTKASTGAVWTALVTVYVVWGSTYLGIRIVVESDIPPLLGMGTRFLAASALLLGFLAVRRGVRALRPTRRELRGAAIVGVLLLLGGNGGVAVAEQTVPSGLAALIVGAVPLWFVLLRVSGGERPRALTWLGVLVGFGGIAAISLPRGGIEGVEAWGVVLILLATVSWAIGSYLSPRVGLPREPLVATAYEMLMGGAVMTAVALAVGEGGDLDLTAIPREGYLAWVYLVLAGSLLGYTAYVFALAHAPLSLVGTYAYVNPVVAVALGAVILGEPVTAVVLGGGALVVAGVALVVSGERSRPRPVDPPAEPVPDLVGPAPGPGRAG